MHRTFVAAVCGPTIVLAALVGCSKSPAAPTPPSSQPTPAAPRAILSIGGGDVAPALVIGGFTPIVFDASKSTGTGLVYTIEFGDGTSASGPVATHVPKKVIEEGVGRALTAKLTVTDVSGRTDSAVQQYFVAGVENISATFWLRYVTGTGQRSLVFKQEGAALSGWYKGPEFSGYQHFTGALTGERALTLRTDDGHLELTGSLEWRSDPRYVNGVSLFMRKSGAGEDSKMEFTFANPY